MRSMSNPDAEKRVDALPLKARLEAYYGRYYGDVLGIPGWRDLVAVRLDDTAYEGERLARLERAVGRHVAGARLLNVGCGTGGFNEVARGAGVDAWGLDAAAVATGHVRSYLDALLTGPASRRRVRGRGPPR